MSEEQDVGEDESGLVTMTPRSYQVKMEKQALAHNTLIFLPTGSGKTFIAIQVIKRLQNALFPKYSEGGKRCFFLVNNVPLVAQQADMLARQVSLSVQGLSSENKVDFWTKDKWLAILEETQVFVMTAQILADTLRHAYITLDRINLLIFDECHHAVDDHPMRSIMTEFAYIPPASQPKVLGLTAVLLNKTVKVDKVDSAVVELESTFNSKVATVDSMDEVLGFSTNPKEFCSYYEVQPLHQCFASIRVLFEQLGAMAKSIKIPETFTTPSSESTGKLMKKPLKLQKLLVNMTSSIERINTELGLYGGSLAMLYYIIQCERIKLSADSIAKTNTIQLAITYLNQARAIAEQVLESCQDPAERLLKFSSPKVRQLISILKEYSPAAISSHQALKVNTSRVPLRGLIFVKERFTCKVLNKVVEHCSKLIPHLEYVKCDFIVGANVNPYSDTREELFNKKQNMLVLEKFRAKQLNCIVSTEVLEEGVDIPTCNLIVRMDPIVSFRSYIQAKGRGRCKKATYIIMVSQSDQAKFESKYEEFKRIEETLTQILVGKTEDRSMPSIQQQANKFEQAYPPYVHGKCHVTMLSAISLLSRYCQTLPQDKFTALEPFFYLEQNTKDKKLVSVLLPVCCPVKDLIMGALMNNTEDAKRVAALKACELLHKAGELNDHLLPRDRRPHVFDTRTEEKFFAHWVEEETVQANDNSKIKAGARNRKRLHFKKTPNCLSGSSLSSHKDEGCKYHVYSIKVVAHAESTNNQDILILQQLLNSSQGYLLLTVHPLPKICPFSIFLPSGRVTVTFAGSSQTVMLSSVQMQTIKRFHMLVFLDVLEIMKEFTCYDATRADYHCWITPTTDGQHISWDLLERYESVEKLDEPSLPVRKATSTDPEHYRHMIVSPWYRPTDPVPKYIVTRVLGTTPLDPFSDASHTSYASYFKAKYNLTLLGSPHQPMLEVQYLSNKMNCLLPRSISLQSEGKKRPRRNSDDQFARNRSEQLVPEFCVRYSFPGVLWLKATMLPSILHRLTHILSAEELRSEIIRETGLGCATLPPDFKWEEMSSDVHSVSMAQLNEASSGKREVDVDVEEASEDVEMDGQSGQEVMEEDVSADMSVLNTIMDVDKFKLAFNQLSSSFPWDLEMEPIDIERQFDSVSFNDIQCYDRFISHKVASQESTPRKAAPSNRGTVMAETIMSMRAICPPPYRQVQSIDILKKRLDAVGPHPGMILRALTTSKANDIFNLERAETLGDTFLKFGVSMYLIHKYPHYDEGMLTSLKSKIVSNRNLYYSGLKRGLPGRIKMDKFSAKAGWIPPCFTLERNLQKILITNNVSPSALYFTRLSREEMLSGRILPQSWKKIEECILQWECSVYPADMDAYVGRQEVPDKVVADCVEALIGTYLENGGIPAAFSMLKWLHVLPSEDNLEDILAWKLQTVFSKGEASYQQLDFLLDYCISKIEETVHYKFKDPALLLEAFTHSSCTRNRVTGSYERLEFIGDAILDFLVTTHIYERGDRLSPGELTDLRSALVNNNTFACLVVRLGLHKFLQTSNSLLDSAINRFVALQESKGHIVDESVLHLLAEEDCQLAQYVEVPKALGDIFESLAGAIFLDSGGDLETVWKIYFSIMSQEIALFMQNVPKNPCRVISEQIHAMPKFMPSKVLTDGTVMMPLSLWIAGQQQIVYGFGSNNVHAKKSASKVALRLLQDVTI